ncbi:MAG: sigma-54 dependent transcriptional regulator, partial [Burkholderiaceae bacterium]|nr:sigma-54 dependent transcriptional regulator [Burkholderiaceae bacterium]
IESEIFGHEKGSFTGAERMHQGFFERANGGTLFLDEVTEMPLDLQVKLLRVLETGRFMRVGSTQSLESDVRVIAATNRDADQAVRAGKLREDLLYRLNVFPIELPPLRERLADVPLLAEHFLVQIGQKEGKARRFTAAALQRLTAYHWPGNVRELRNVVQRAYVMASGDEIDTTWLPKATGTPVPDAEPAGAANGIGAPAAASASAGAAAGGAPASAPGTVTLPLGISMARAEKLLILATLEHCQHQRERTAAMLGISLKTLYNRLKEYSAEDGERSAS